MTYSHTDYHLVSTHIRLYLTSYDLLTHRLPPRINSYQVISHLLSLTHTQTTTSYQLPLLRPLVQARINLAHAHVGVSCSWSITCWGQERPYNHDSTASRLLSEVKHDLARLVLRWGTTLESLVLFFFLLSLFFSLVSAFHQRALDRLLTRFCEILKYFWKK